MTRGRPTSPKLSKTMIVSTALELARENDRVTLGKVARRLDVHVTSLYNHVDDHADLINAIRDEISSRRTGNPPPEHWDDIFYLLARRMREMFKEYPGLIVPFATTPVQSTQIGSFLHRLTDLLQHDVGSRKIAEAGVRALNSLIIGGALDSLDPSTSPESTEAALNLGVESLVRALKEPHPQNTGQSGGLMQEQVALT